MSTFAQLIAKTTGVGVAYLVEVSTDRFSTVSYYWGSKAGKLDGTNEADPRLLGVGALHRALSPAGFAASSTSLALDNSDGGLDWLVSRATVESTLLKSKFRISLCVWDVTNPSDTATKVLGVFVALNYPKRNGARIDIDLADNALSDACELALAPTLQEWLDDSGTNSTNAPFTPIARVVGTTDYNQPAPVAFNTTVPAPLVGWDATKSYAAVLLCATTDTAAVTTTDVTDVEMKVPGLNPRITPSSGWLGLPQTYTKGGLSVALWDAKKTQSITKDGKTWKLIWALLYLDNIRDYLVAEAFIAPLTITVNNGYTTVTVTRDFVDEVLVNAQFRATGFPLSGRSYYGLARTYGLTAPAIIYDLLSSYSRELTLSDLDADSFNEVLASYPFTMPASFYSGGLLTQSATYGEQPSRFTVGQGLLRRAVGNLCQSGFVDVATGWDGKFKAIATNVPYGATVDAFGGAAPSLDELLASNISDHIPSQGERWAPYNRIFVHHDQGTYGPLDDAAAIASWGRVLTRDLRMSGVDYGQLLLWSGNAFGLSVGVYEMGFLESKVRPILSLMYPLDALTLELGDYFTFSWTRGGLAAPYEDTLFRVESLTLNPNDCTVDVTAVWMGNLQTDLPFLLDDVSLYTRVSATFGRTVTVTDGDSLVIFSSGDLVADGVAAGDLLVLKDSTQADDVFTRFRAIRIVSVNSANEMNVDSTDLDFGPDSVSGIAVADWTIVRGATTFHTVSTDPTNYADGGYMYGKATSDADVFSGAIPDGPASTAGNKLMDG